MTSKSALLTKADDRLITTTTTDQRGQVYTTKRPDSTVVQHLGPLVHRSTDPLKEGTYEASSNPYYPTGDDYTTTDATMGWQRTKRDKMGRIVEVRFYSGSARPEPWGTNASDIGTVTTTYDGISKTVTDEAGKKRKLTVDGAGRLVEVVEDPDGLNYTTRYGYDFADNLTSVTQGSQTRTFVYSSLGRLTSATNPESGTIAYRYDRNGNLLTRTDARNVVTTYGFDNLNRLATKQYVGWNPERYLLL